MTTILSTLLCVGMLQGAPAREYLYRLQISDSTGVLMKPNIRDVEKEPATLTESMKNGDTFQIKLTPAFKSDQLISTRIDFKVFAKDVQPDDKAAAKIQAVDRFESKPGETTYYLVKNGIPKRVRSKNPAAHEDELLLSIRTSFTAQDHP